MDTDAKYAKLMGILKAAGRVAVAFSGGVDSTLLLKCAIDAVGEANVLALTAESVIHIPDEKKAAAEFATACGIRHVVVQGREMEDPAFTANPPDKCYICKKGNFAELRKIAAAEGFPFLADGTNASDEGDYRPGMKALAELGIRSPLREAGLVKDEIRALSKQLGLSTWDKPAFACLASRIAYGETITADKLKMIAKGEKFLRELGFRQCRIRLHKGCARIEVMPEERSRFFDEAFMEKVAARLANIGFSYSALDLRGYRTGSMNEVLDKKGK